jgi:hypothetical protein
MLEGSRVWLDQRGGRVSSFCAQTNQNLHVIPVAWKFVFSFFFPNKTFRSSSRNNLSISRIHSWVFFLSALSPEIFPLILPRRVYLVACEWSCVKVRCCGSCAWSVGWCMHSRLLSFFFVTNNLSTVALFISKEARYPNIALAGVDNIWMFNWIDFFNSIFFIVIIVC